MTTDAANRPPAFHPCFARARHARWLAASLALVGCMEQPNDTAGGAPSAGSGSDIAAAVHEGDGGIVSRTEKLTARATNGYAWVRSPSSTGDHTLSPREADSVNSHGASNHIDRTGTGQYTVTLELVGGSGGTAQVVAYNTGNRRCKIKKWEQSGEDEKVYVLCHDYRGNAANARFVLQYQRLGDDRVRSAYLWANDPDSGSWYQPTSRYSYNSRGQANWVIRHGEGHYKVHMYGMDVNGGNVQVTSHGGNADHCKVQRWARVDDHQEIEVRCFDTNGFPNDGRFVVQWEQAGPHHRIAGHAFLNDMSSSLYFPSSAHRRNLNRDCVNDTVVAGRISKGRYSAGYKNFDDSLATVHVTAFGDQSHYCNIESWRRNPDNGFFEVKSGCYDKDGSRVDSRYTQNAVSWYNASCN